MAADISGSSSATASKVGPNAVTQLMAAMQDAYGEAKARALFNNAGVPGVYTDPPAAMIDQKIAQAAFGALRQMLAPEAASAVLYSAGKRTGDYLLANRIPSFAQMILRALPAKWAIPVLLKAIHKHAWTFAGSGDCTIATTPTAQLSIAANPLATPGCPWHSGVVETVFNALLRGGADVKHTTCCGRGDTACRFEIKPRG